MCRAQTAPLLVMDVEGTDGRERGEDQDFERKSALFSLASSEVSRLGSLIGPFPKLFHDFSCGCLLHAFNCANPSCLF
jgi:hypothetical protein